MMVTKIKHVLIIGMMVLPMLSWSQKASTQSDSLKINQAMKNIIVMGKIFIPKNSIEDFRKQNVTSGYLKTLPGYVKGEIYEMLDDSGNLNMITITTWRDQESYHNAQNSLKEYYKEIKFNPMVFRNKLKVVAEHGLYTLRDN